MVKIKFEICQKKTNLKKEYEDLNQTRKKKTNIEIKIVSIKNYEPNDQNENDSLFSDGKNYSPKIRYIVLFRLLKLVEQINKQIKLPDNFIFSTIALLDSYLSKSSEYVYPK